MINPTGKKPQPIFAVDGSARARPALRRREVLTLGLLCACTIALLVVILGRDGTGRDEEPVGDPTVVALTAMAPIDLEAVTAVLAVAQPAEHHKLVAELREDPRTWALSLRGLQEPTLAWAKAQIAADRRSAPLPQGFQAADLAGVGVAAGSAVLTAGTLMGLQEFVLGEQTWLALDVQTQAAAPSLHVLVIVPHAATPEAADPPRFLELGQMVQLAGRMLGPEDLPSESGDEQRTPVIAAWNVNQRREGASTALPGMGVERDLPRGGFIPDPAVYEQIDDQGHILELRPYYHILGRILRDRSLPAYERVYEDIGALASALHQAPAEHRERLVEVEGMVLTAWEDRSVARDQPYGIRRVQRIWLWRTLYGYGPRPENVLYELAVIADDDRPLPEPRTRIRAQGRFLKMQGYRVPPNQLQEMVRRIRVERHSNSTWFAFVAAGNYQVLEPIEGINWLPWIFSLGLGALFLMALLGYLARRDEQGADRWKHSVRRLRENRRQLKAAERLSQDPVEKES